MNKPVVFTTTLFSSWALVTLICLIIYGDRQEHDEIYNSVPKLTSTNNGDYNILFNIHHLVSLIFLTIGIQTNINTNGLRFIIIGLFLQTVAYGLSFTTFIINCRFAVQHCHTVVTPLYVLVLIHFYLVSIFIILLSLFGIVYYIRKKCCINRNSLDEGLLHTTEMEPNV